MHQKKITTKAKKRSYFIFFLLAIIFIGPIIAAWTLFEEHGKWGEGETINHGHLITPPLPINKLQIKNERGALITQKQTHGKWLLAYVNPKQCGELCRTNLYNMRQIRLALAKDQHRVKRALILLSNDDNEHIRYLLANGYVGTSLFYVNKKNLSAFLKPLPSQKAALNKGYLYLVDPLGNVMMSYTPYTNPSDILKDMQRLLKVSQIG